MPYKLYWTTSASICASDVKINGSSATNGADLADGDVITYSFGKDGCVINGGNESMPMEYTSTPIEITDANVLIYGYNPRTGEWTAPTVQ